MQKIANGEIFLLFFVKKGQELKENLYFCTCICLVRQRCSLRRTESCD